MPNIILDHAQKRYARDRIGISLAGEDLSAIEFENNTYIVPVTKDLILLPACADRTNWATTNSAPYDKLGLSAFGSPSGFQEMDPTGLGAWPRIIGPANTTLQTTTTYPVNTGFYISYYAYGVGGNGVAVECGWADLPGVDNDLGLRFFLSGFCEVWLGGLIIGSGNVSGSRYSDRRTSAEYVEVAVMPSRLRELVIWSLNGNGFSTIIPDIAEDATSPVITPASKFWIKTVDCSCNVMVAPLKFATSGTAVSQPFDLAEAPDSSDSYERWDNASWAGGTNKTYRLYGHQSYRTGNSDAASAALVKDNGSTFTFDGSTIRVRIKTTLSGNGYSSPTIYGCQMGVAALPALTDDSEVADVTDSTAYAKLTVSDGGGVSASIDLIDPVTLSETVAGLLEGYKRPVKFDEDGVVWFDGRCHAPTYERSLTPLGEALPLDCDDQITGAMKTYQFRERFVHDGLLLSHATGDCLIRRYLKTLGLADSDMQLETSTAKFGDIPGATSGDFNDVADLGATMAEIIDRAFQDVLGGWSYGPVPTASGIKYQTKSPTTLDAQSPVIHLYWRTADAIAAGIAADEAWKHVYRSFKREVIPSEANEVNITGYSPRYQLPLSARKRDADSQDPTIPPSARASNWHGEPVRAGIINKGITMQAMASDGCVLKAGQLFQSREVCTFVSEFLTVSNVPVWRTQKVRLHDALGDGVDVDTIIQTIEAEFVKEPNGDDAWQWRPATYVGSNVMGNSGGVTISEVKKWAQVNAARGVVQRRNSIGVSTQRFLEIAVL